MAFVARQFIYPFSSGPSVGINSVMANSRPSIRYELIHSLNRPRFTVCPGQTWNVAPTRNEKFMSFQRPDWHVCPLCQSGIWKTQGSKGGQYVLRKFWPSGVVVPSNHVACQSNPVTGTCSCPGNTVDYGYMTGQSKLYDSFDTFFETHFCIER